MPHQQTIGTRAQVFHGTAKHTSGGLHKSDLMQNKAGRIVSRRKHHSAKKEMRLVKHGFGTKKGKFGFVKLNKSKSRRHKHRGGSKMGVFSPAELDYTMSMPSVSSGTSAMAGGSPYGQSFSPSDLEGLVSPAAAAAAGADAPKMQEGGKGRGKRGRMSRGMNQQRQRQQQRQQQRQRQQQVAGNAEVDASYMLDAK